MNKTLLIFIAVTLALITGYWLGSGQSASMSGIEESAQPERKILYYRNPMGLPDISPVPKKDSMGMDYIPVYEGEELQTDSTAVQINTEKIQKLGVRTEPAAYRVINRKVQALATIQPNERLLHTVTPKFEGWIQKLYVNTNGQAIKRGEALMDVYSPELITAQHEYLIAAKGMHWSRESDPEVQARMQRLSKNALQKLYNWDIAEIDLRALQHEGTDTAYFPLRSQFNGVVIKKNVTQGQRFMPGEVLYEIADLSQVWVLAEVFEQDLRMIHVNQTATITVDAYPDKSFNGKVTFIYPTVTPETRTTKVRIELPNEAALLKPEMYARVEFTSLHHNREVLAVPNTAILNTGTQQVVLVASGAGRFEPRTITSGMQADKYTEVLSGLEAGETVVTRANFLIDAESNLKAALAGFNQPSTSLPDTELDVNPAPSTARHHTLHRVNGVIKSIDWSKTTVTIAHDPVPGLQWPAMTMDFTVVDEALLQSIKPEQPVTFDLADESGGFIIRHIYPAEDNTTRHHHHHGDH